MNCEKDHIEGLEKESETLMKHLRLMARRLSELTKQRNELWKDNIRLCKELNCPTLLERQKNEVRPLRKGDRG